MISVSRATCPTSLATLPGPRPLEGTDLKVFNTVVVGQILTELGALIALASTVCFFAISTQFAIGIAIGASSIAIGSILTSQASRTPLPRSAGKPLPFVTGQPVGLDNESANCWTNSVLQLLFNAPNLRRKLHSQGPSAIKNAHLAYEKTRSAKEHVSSTVNSQNIRKWLASQIPGISRDADDQEDAQEALAHIMRNFPPTTFEVRRHSGSMHADERWRLLTLSLDSHRKAANLEQLFDCNFLTFHDGAGGGRRRFRDCPDDLTFHFARFGMGRHGPRKIDDHLNIGNTFKIPATWTISKRSANYECQAFIEHIGDSIEGGHYVAYTKVKGQWWCCDDNYVYKVDKDEAEDKIKDSYIAHYART